MARKVKRIGTFDCGDGEHQVVTTETERVEGQGIWHCRKPCEQCPWRKDVPTGVFPVSAYQHSARTAYDMSINTFACHMRTPDKPATCAGFLMRGADHNLGVRLAILDKRYDPRTVSDGGYPLYRSYREMAIANGVDEYDPDLVPCRGVDEDWRKPKRR